MSHAKLIHFSFLLSITTLGIIFERIFLSELYNSSYILYKTISREICLEQL